MADRGAGFVRSNYSWTGGNIYGEILSERTPRMEVLGGLDYICQGNETEQKLSNVMLFERILHVLNSNKPAATFFCEKQNG